MSNFFGANVRYFQLFSEHVYVSLTFASLRYLHFRISELLKSGLGAMLDLQCCALTREAGLQKLKRL